MELLVPTILVERVQGDDFMVNFEKSFMLIYITLNIVPMFQGERLSRGTPIFLEVNIVYVYIAKFCENGSQI